MLACRERENTETQQICVVLRPTRLPTTRQPVGLTVIGSDTLRTVARTDVEKCDDTRLLVAAQAFLRRVGR